MFKKTILIDLDGVLNTYDGKFDEKYIPPIKEGALDFIKELSDKFKIKIFATRNSLLTSEWIIQNGLKNILMMLQMLKYRATFKSMTDVLSLTVIILIYSTK